MACGNFSLSTEKYSFFNARSFEPLWRTGPNRRKRVKRQHPPNSVGTFSEFLIRITQWYEKYILTTHKTFNISGGSRGGAVGPYFGRIKNIFVTFQ
jgi:hypothetical protein